MNVVRREVSDRTVFGKICKWVFILFNAIMAFLLFRGCMAAGEHMNNYQTEAARTGSAIGATIGLSMVLFIWLAGVVILGFFVVLTRRKKIIEVDE